MQRNLFHKKENNYSKPLIAYKIIDISFPPLSYLNAHLNKSIITQFFSVYE